MKPRRGSSPGTRVSEQFDPDTDPVTDCFYNDLGITDSAELAVVEYKLTMIRGRRLAIEPVPGVFDFAHLKAIHQALFGGIYPWAGMPRKVNTGRTVSFCQAEFIDSSAEAIFTNLAAEQYLCGLSRDDFVDAAAQLYDAMNHLHPFREGNGRANCQFHTQLAAQAGWELDWRGLDKAGLDHAARVSMSGTHKPLAEAIDPLVRAWPEGQEYLPPALIRRDRHK